MGVEETEQYKEWVKGLKRGDTVIYKNGRSFSNRMNKATVIGITPTGRIRLDDGTQWYHYGRGMGDYSWQYLDKYTDEIKASEAKEKAVKFLKSYKWESMEISDLLAVMAVIRRDVE